MPPVSGCLVPSTSGVIPLFHRRFRVSYFIQIPKAIRLKVNKCRALSSPRPKRPCGIRAYKTPARPRWGLCFCVSGGCTSSSIPECLSGTNLAFIGYRNGQGAPSATRQRAKRVARDLYHVAVDSLRTAGLAVIRYAKIHGAKHRPWLPWLTALLTWRPTKVQLPHLPTRSQGWRAMMAKGERYKEPETPSSQLLSG
jgi:hypothetical protein